MAVSRPAVDQEVAAPVSRPVTSEYTAWYCEENIYQLLSRLDRVRKLPSWLYAVFISNPNRQIPLWCQKSGDDSHNGFICYDYHVIALEFCPDQQSLVYDFDSLLPFPSNWETYAHATLHPLPGSLRSPYSRYFHIIDAATFLNDFASDRSHMKWPDGSWKAPPPLHACISAKGGSRMNLEDFIAMKPSNDKGATAYGLVLNEDAFELWLASEGQSHEPVAIPMKVAMQP